MEPLSPGLIAELACGVSRWDELERDSCQLVMDTFGADTVFFVGREGIGGHARGVINEVRDRFARVGSAADAGLEPVVRAAIASGGVTIDRELLGDGVERLPYYDVLMRPVRGRETMFGVLLRDGRPVQKIVLGRCHGSSAFTPTHRRRLRSLLPTFSLAFAALEGAALKPAPEGAALKAESAALSTLTPRERDVLSYLRLGYTNAQIGLALGTRPRTVRNQLSRVYEKLGVATRAEAVAALLDA